MMRILGLFFVAVLGGAVALGINEYITGSDDQPVVVHTIPARSDQVPATFTRNMPVAGANLPDFTEVAEQTVNAVVHIRAEFERRGSPHNDFFGQGDIFDFFFGPRQRRPAPERAPVIGSGSGVIISQDGYVLTNNHVIENANKIEVTLNDNRMYEARLIGSDPTTDLALLKIDEQGLPFLGFGDSDELRVGEWVLAIGNPFNLASTVTAGIVSAKGRNINILTEEMAIESFIQTDAAVNRGNSGGALVNTRGELIGINTAIASTTGSFAGYSFAIPSNIALKVMEDLLEYGEVQRGLLGVTISPLTSRRAEELGLGVIQGAYVEEVGTNSAGEEAGLKKGDVILSIDNAKVRNPSELVAAVGRKRPGDTINIRYYRNGREREATATLKNIYGEIAAVTRDTRDVSELLGARFELVSEEDLQQLNIEHGIQVISLTRGALSNAGIRRGFIITHMDNQAVASPADVHEIIRGRTGGILVEGVYPNGQRAYYGVGLGQ
ncbi:MAG: Do family serine endopeptidase [Bacteroidales bacterium]|nr:Do family serine endopeptidase [Bacteroidales bacterium]